MPEKLGAHGQMREYDKKDGQYLPDSIQSMSAKELSNEIKINISKKQLPKIKVVKGKDNVYPELSQEALKEMGITENKKVLLKKEIIERNLSIHKDISISEMENIIEKALYDFDEILPGRNEEQKYFSFVKFIRQSRKKGTPIHGVVLLDVNINNDNFEIVHCHLVREKNYKTLK